ncbi:MAG: acetyl-CoA C-acetyltransferase [Acidobacteria bacterium]|nr:MAG: acetyl-CoA C-acetyltransferase [Acidobacteriota bacterium]
MSDNRTVILSGARTPMAEYNGSLAGVSEIELGAHAARHALKRAGIAGDEVDHTVMGNAMQTSSNAIYGARHVGLKAGVPVDRPALTVNRICGSGIQSVISADHLIRLGEAEVVLAGGMENMSQAPYVLRGARAGWANLGTGRMEDSLLAGLTDNFCGFSMAATAENLAREMDIDRRDMDTFAALSQERAQDFHESGRAAEEIVPYEVPNRRGPLVIEADDHMRPGTTVGMLSRLKPAFQKDGSVTAGNASGIVDGAAALVLCSGRRAARQTGTPLGRVLAHAVVGVEPRIMGIGPVPAIQAVLARAGMTLGQIDLFEINEAFAAQYLAVEKSLDLDRDRVNVNGGAIALGHPLGATGTRLILTLLMELRRRQLSYGIASACIGGGQGIAILVESIH